MALSVLSVLSALSSVCVCKKALVSVAVSLPSPSALTHSQGSQACIAIFVCSRARVLSMPFLSASEANALLHISFSTGTTGTILVQINFELILLFRFKLILNIGIRIFSFKSILNLGLGIFYIFWG